LDEAAKEAVEALKYDPRNARAHMILAGILLDKKETLPQAIQHLAAAQDQFPKAKEALQKLCAAEKLAGCP
jgi:hypothetical protein